MARICQSPWASASRVAAVASLQRIIGRRQLTGHASVSYIWMSLACFTFCRVPEFVCIFDRCQVTPNVLHYTCVFSDVFSTSCTSFFCIFKNLWQSQPQLLFLCFGIRCKFQARFQRPLVLLRDSWRHGRLAGLLGSGLGQATLGI